MLYMIGTSIGNVRDTTYRVIETLTQVDIILAEDTRSFGNYYQKIQTLFDIYPQSEQTIRSFYTQNEFERSSIVLEELKSGRDVAVVSEAGMPLISDPGALLVKHAIKNDIDVTVIPGPTAFVSAAVISGLDVTSLLFIGFLPKKENQRIKILEKLNPDTTLAFYESPERLRGTLELIDKHYPDADVSIARELTKKFEEIRRGKAKDLILDTYKGEITVLFKKNFLNETGSRHGSRDPLFRLS